MQGRGRATESASPLRKLQCDGPPSPLPLMVAIVNEVMIEG